MNKKALIYGSNGQDGIYLTQLLKQRSFDVLGLDRKSAAVSGYRINEFVEVSKAIKDIMPSLVFHLAANSTTRLEALLENQETICTGTINILEAVRLFSPETKVFLSGSGLQFENTGERIHESNPFHAGSAYAVSRIHSTYAARFYRSLGIKVYVGYFFNHDSPYRSERHINKKISETVKRIASGSSEKILIGDLTAVKEYGFAKDIAEGILTLTGQDDIYESVVGTGVGHSIEEWVEICCSYFNLNWRNYVEIIPGFVSEYPRLVSDPSTIFSLGWKPKTSINALAQMMIEE